MIRKIFLLVLALNSLNVSAKDLVREFKVSSVQYRNESKDHRVIFKGQAGVYHSSDQAITECLMRSIEEKSKVQVHISSKDLKVIDCKKMGR